MPSDRDVEVAILLATYNGERFVEQQVRSFRDNSVRFTLHWLDDHSTDGTPARVRTAAANASIALKEWHEPSHLGVPGAFFRLLECVDADIYLFSDQDDIWQPGKIDATVAALIPEMANPVLCLSDPLTFKGEKADSLHSFFGLLGVRDKAVLNESRLFMTIAQGNTEGFTSPLREIFMKHKSIAHDYAFMHDLWLYDVAVASGTVRLLRGAPTVLYRIHQSNTSGSFGKWREKTSRIIVSWEQHQRYRRGLAKHARGFLLASSTLPRGQKLDRALRVAELVSTLDRRQSLGELLRLVRLRVMWPAWRLSLGLSAACLLSDATSN